MQIIYTVHSSHIADADLDVKLPNGQTVSARVPSLVVELVSECEGMGHTLRLQPLDMAAAQTLFTVGNKVAAAYTAMDAAAAAAAPDDGQ